MFFYLKVYLNKNYPREHVIKFGLLIFHNVFLNLNYNYVNN